MKPTLAADHVAIPVADAAASLAFYRDFLGLPLHAVFEGDDWGGHPWLMMVFALADGRQLALCALRGYAPARAEHPEGTHHLALAATSARALAAWKRRLTTRKISFSEEEHGPQRSIYFHDPDGTVLEITWPPSPRLLARTRTRGADRAVRAWIAAGAHIGDPKR